MSYSCAILSDENNSQYTSLSSLKAFLDQTPHITAQEGETRHFSYDKGELHFVFTLDVVDEDGETLVYDFDAGALRADDDPLVHDKVNQITASCAHDQSAILDLWDVCFSIAEHLDWQVQDRSSGEIIEPY